MGYFGFSYVGLVYMLMLFIPNIMWVKYMPKGYDANEESKMLQYFERVGEVCVTACAICFSNFNLHGISMNSIWLLLSFGCMLLYEGYWIRYFRSERTLKDFYCSFAGIPIAGASLPVIAFLLLGIYGNVIWMILSALILGIGHIGIHMQHKRAFDK